MTSFFGILALLCFGFALFLLFKNKQLEEKALRVQEEAQASIARTQEEADRSRQHFESETQRVYSEAQAGVAEAQRQIDQQAGDLKLEIERIKQHYEAEARKSQQAADALVATTIRTLEPLRKYELLRNAEEEVKQVLADALSEAAALRKAAQQLSEQAQNAAANERSLASQRAREIREQADALLNQATRDAGRIMAEAEKRAEQIGGDAYVALRDKQLLEQAAAAMRNVIEGYGDRYIIPTHSLLDDLAAEFGYDSAGQALKSARDHSRRMVEQGEAAACDYAEANRREIAIRFAVDAFNGRVDAILSRSKHDNFGTLEQEVRDAFSLVNLNGQAFRNARILPAYLDARLAELKWAVVVHELALRAREEQRYLREQERDRQKAEEERQRKLHEAAKEKELAAKEEELRRAALIEAEERLAQAHAEDKVKFQQEVERLHQAVADANQKLADATRRELTIAQQTIKGRVYIISNIGSFGEIDSVGLAIYKIGLTRRPAQERVDELGDASVPFEFDIHAVIETDNAPALEYKLHKALLGARVNKFNLRKEFFRVSLNDIRQVVEKLKPGEDCDGNVIWTEKARAAQFYDTRDIDTNSPAKEKWLNLQAAKIERRLRQVERELSLPTAMSEIEANGNGQES